MKIFYFIVLSLCLKSCTETISINNEISKQHIYVINTDCYLIPPKDAKETREYSGFQDKGFEWSIQVKKEKMEMSYFEKLYSSQNLHKTDRELIECEDVLYSNKFKGFFVKHKSTPRRQHGYGLVLDCIDYRVHVNAWIRDRSLDKYQTDVINSMFTLYIADPKSIDVAMNIPFTVETNKLKFVSIDENGDYVYEKSLSDESNFKLILYHDTSILDLSNSTEYFFNSKLGEDYFKIGSKLIDSTLFTKYTLIEAVNRSKTKKVIVGYNKINIDKRYYFTAEYDSNFKSNDSLVYSIAENIKYYK